MLTRQPRMTTNMVIAVVVGDGVRAEVSWVSRESWSFLIEVACGRDTRTSWLIWRNCVARFWAAGRVGGGESASVRVSAECAKVGRVGKSAQETYRELQQNGSRSNLDEPLVKNVSISSLRISTEPRAKPHERDKIDQDMPRHPPLGRTYRRLGAQHPAQGRAHDHAI